MEHQLIKLLLNKAAFTELQPYIYPKALTSSIRDLYFTLVKAHEQFSKDLSLEELKIFYKATHTDSESKLKVLDIIFNNIRNSEPLSEELVKTVALKLSKQKIAQEAIELLAPIVLGHEDNIITVVDMLNEHKFVTPTNTIEKVTVSIEELLPLSMPENRYAFALSILNEKILGAGPGNFVIVFGRPEMGKSTFVADNNIGYLRQGLKVAYFGNEEPGWKIMMNHIRSCTEMSDKMLQDNFKKGVTSYESWDSIKENFSLFDCVGMHVNAVNHHILSTGADVVIIDQMDKLVIDNTPNQERTRLKSIYVQAREIAKKNNVLVIGVSQASAEAENKRYPTFSMMDESRTGKAGEADVIIGIGKWEGDAPNFRNLEVSKNKISGWKGHVPCQFLTDICRVTK